MDDDSALVLSHLTKSFAGKRVLKDIDFTFESGKIYGLLGRNGAGKTTLFNCLNADLPLDSGEFYLTTGHSERERREIQPDDIGYVLSTPEVPEFLTAREFLQFFIDINAERISHLATLDAYFDSVRSLPEDRDRLLKDYSQGMKNKMQMLVNIIAEPLVTLLDEPMTSLDVVVAEEMKELLKSMKSGRITILSTHILDLAVDLCDEIVLLSGGRLSSIPHENLDDENFKATIIETLRESDNGR